MKKMLVILAVLLLGTTNVFPQEQTPKDVERFMRLGKKAYESAEYEKAIKHFIKITDRIGGVMNNEDFRLNNYISPFVNSIYYISRCLSAVGEYEKAVEYGEATREFYKLLSWDKSLDYARLLNHIANDYGDLEDYDKAIELGEQAVEVINNTSHIASFDEKKYYESVFWNLTNYYDKVFRYADVIKSVEHIITIEKEIYGENNSIYAKTLCILAKYYCILGDYTKSVTLGEQVVNINNEIIDDKDPFYARSLSDLSIYYTYIGNYSKAIELSKQACAINQKILNAKGIDYARSLNNLATAYFEAGNHLKAIEIWEKTSGIFDVNDPNYALLLRNLSLGYIQIGNYTKATDLLEQAISVYKNTRDIDDDYSHLLGTLALCYTHKENYTAAIDLHTQALDLIKKIGGDNIYYAVSLINLAINYRAIGNYDEAINLINQALVIAKDRLGKLDHHRLDPLGLLAGTLYRQGTYNNIPSIWKEFYLTLKQNALSQFREMTSIQRQLYWEANIISRTVLSNNSFTKVLSNDKQSMGLSYNSLLFSKGVILASDIEFDKVIRESGDTVLLEKFEELRTTRAILNTYYNKPIAERPEGEVERLESRAEVLEKDLLEGSKEYADFTRRLEIEWQDVQAALGDKDVAIEILAADEHIDEDTPPYYAALVLRKGWDAPKFVELCGAEELQAYFDSENGLAMMYREANSRKLYDLIWGKLAEHIDEGDNIYFSPGGLLHQVNVELLQDADGRLANEKYNLHRVSSTRELCFEKPKIAHSEAVLYGGLRYDLDSTTMIAQSRAVRPEEEHYALRGLQLDSLRGKLNYLSASKSEVEKISKQMNQHGIKTTLYIEQVGNEESFKALSGNKTPIIHLATHGFFFKNEEAKVKPFFRMMSMDQERPRPDNSLRRSGLAFAGAQKAWDGEEIPKGIDDGVMLAQEIASMDLAGTDLVVLSACETGLGEINSEGVFGLQRAFKKAGVQTLIMSLWKVHDEATALFMQIFYENLFSGKSKRDSFAAAQMALREHRDYGKDPAYWAAFVMLD